MAISHTDQAAFKSNFAHLTVKQLKQQLCAKGYKTTKLLGWRKTALINLLQNLYVMDTFWLVFYIVWLYCTLSFTFLVKLFLEDVANYVFPANRSDYPLHNPTH